MRVDDLYKKNDKPVVTDTASIREVIVEITKKRLGVTAVINKDEMVVGIITDGDLRRMLESNENFSTLKALDIASKNPKCIGPEKMAIEALAIFREFDITQLLVIEDNTYKGVLHLHNLVEEGIV
jgi:arabinose-5-phosphate isomerase